MDVLGKQIRKKHTIKNSGRDNMEPKIIVMN
jgi:hypothetical protein